mgnify:CR=1 FL=1
MDNSASCGENEERQGYIADSDLSTIVGDKCQFRFQVFVTSCYQLDEQSPLEIYIFEQPAFKQYGDVR